MTGKSVEGNEPLPFSSLSTINPTFPIIANESISILTEERASSPLMTSTEESVTPIALSTAMGPINIALIKYWGKRDEELNLPVASSFSITLEAIDVERLITKTVVSVSIKDQIILNGQNAELNSRIQKVLRYIRSLVSLSAVKIESWNSFPTSTGLASSASGYAALVKALSSLTSPKMTLEQQMIAARLGSGSACRSLLDGFVKWTAGKLTDGSDSIPHPIFPVDHWPELECSIYILDSSCKLVSSATGMERTIKTSELFKFRTVEDKIERIIQAIKDRDFESFAEITMKDSNQFHALCLDTFPPLLYLNDASRSIINKINLFNEQQGRLVAAYTFDAGPNAFVFYLKAEQEQIESLLSPIISKDTSVIKCRVGRGARFVP